MIQLEIWWFNFAIIYTVCPPWTTTSARVTKKQLLLRGKLLYLSLLEELNLNCHRYWCCSRLLFKGGNAEV